MRTAGHYYLGRWHYATPGEKSIPVTNPANGRMLGEVRAFCGGDVLKEIFNAARAAQLYWYLEVSLDEKEQFLRAVQEELERERPKLTWTMIRETGKLWKWADAEVTEARETTHRCESELAEVSANKGFQTCRMSDKVVINTMEPKGVGVMIGTWNFPLNIIHFWKGIAAVAGGNAVILKPAEQSPFTAMHGLEVIHAAMDKVFGVVGERREKLANLIQMIQGDASTGKLLVESGLYDFVSFTGSEEGGRKVAAAAGAALREVASLELGGHAMMAVLSDFDISRAVDEAIRGCNGDAGERCVSTRAMAVSDRNFRTAQDMYVDRAKRLRVGKPEDAESYFGPLVSKEQLERVHSQVMRTVAEGGKLLLGGYPLTAATLARAKAEGLNVDETAILEGGNYYPPTVLANVRYGMTAMDEEIFGPVICLLPLPGNSLEEQFEEAVRLINQARQGLSNAVLTNDAALLMKVPGRVRSGLRYGRRTTTGAETGQEFGGVKDSGWGREGGSIKAFMNHHTYYIDLANRVRMAQEGDDEPVLARLRNVRSPYFD